MANVILKRGATVTGALAAALMLMTAAAHATEGYFSLGFGPRQTAMGGAGVADGSDAMAAALNPAGIAGMNEQFQLGAGLFMPFRGYDASGTLFVAPGSNDSGANIFLGPNMAYVRPLTEKDTLGFTLYGNGGMNTTFDNDPNPAPFCGGGPGIFCGGGAGVDLIQAFIAATYAHDFGGVKIGISPTFAVQRFKAEGLGPFTPSSSDPTNMTDNGYDYSFGGGLKAGVEVDLTDSIRLGLAGQTKMYMSRFEDYAGLFAEDGDFDIPASVTAGLAVDVTPDLTLALDYQHIFYSGVDSVSNSSRVANPFGSDNGPGFGWSDVGVIKIGAEWRPNEQWKVRAGYAYSANPVDPEDVTLNILAPGIVQHHFTGGFSYKATEHSTFEFTGMFVPESKTSGAEVTPLGPTPGSDVELHMYQVQLMGGWTYDF